MEEYVDDCVAYLYGGGSTISNKGYNDVVMWLKDRHPDIDNATARRAASVAAVAVGRYPVKGFILPYRIDYKYHVSPGDTVTGGRTYYDEYGKAEGVVKEINREDIDFTDGNHCQVDSVYAVKWKDAWKNEPATQKQLDLLKEIKEDHDDKDELYAGPYLTKGEASILIDRWPKPGQVRCWECGCWDYPSKMTTTFFDEFYCGC